jgi:hypothetical protein
MMEVLDNVYTMERLEAVLRKDHTTFESIELDFDSMWSEQAGAWIYIRKISVAIHNLRRTLWFTTCKGYLQSATYSSGGVDITIGIDQFTFGAPDDWEIRKWMGQMASELMP